MEDLCIAWHLAAGVCSARLCLKYSGAGRALAPGGRQIPPGGLSLFRQAVLTDALGGCALGYEFSPFLCVYGDDRVIRYTGADVDTGGAENVQATESVEQDYERGGYKALGLSSPFLCVYGDDRVIRYTGADVDTGGAENVQATE
ncbi:hypothetical protein DEO72_LG4g502 [Vigna unguiculata]|uniref:Uncharacterized protein n=1 Tax=Vigna unguiculata TaxID=3917 RepID=A0A4D6LMT6_VIGUN|nr:hypothetical protein DEO72_LG4g502 [Vigna unguiculata]